MNDKENIKRHIESQKNGKLLSAIANIESGYDNSAVGLAGELEKSTPRNSSIVNMLFFGLEGTLKVAN